MYIPGTTRLQVPIYFFCTSYLFCTFYSIAHFTLYFSFCTYAYALVLCYLYIIFICILLHCPLSGPDLIYISLLIIPCIIYYVTNKETLNLEYHFNLRIFSSKWEEMLRNYSSLICTPYPFSGDHNNWTTAN